MNRPRPFHLSFALLAVFFFAFPVLSASDAKTPPNILVILTDDQGFGDVSHLNPNGRIRTPHMDRLAREGMTFTDAHSGSAVCTPTRYGLLTGRYAWRSPLKNGVLGGLSPLLIEPGRMTIASLLRSRSYHTACLGKWHLGLNWILHEGKSVNVLGIESANQVWNVDYSKPLQGGPLSVGFDHFYGISGSLDMVPYTWIDGDRVSIVPDQDGDFAWTPGQNRRTRRGPVSIGFDAEDVLSTLCNRAIDYIENRASAAREGRPFFLYLALASPHTPILPTKDWQGRSGINSYADFTMETDARIGEVLAALDKHKLTDNTVVVFASDNGCSPEADMPTLAAAGHHPSGPYRGHKADLFEGGHRVPLFVRWPGTVAPGSTYSHTVCLTDLLATAADILNVTLPPDAGEDSVSWLPVLKGETQKPIRTSTIHHSINGSFAIRKGPWKLLLCPDSGGWSAPRPGTPTAKELAPLQLYNLDMDPGETINLAGEQHNIVRELVSLLEEHVRRGRSTPGPAQPIPTPVDIWRGQPRPPEDAL